MNDIVLDTIGFRDDFDRLLARVGWSTFMIVRDLTYAELTIEFLSFLEAEILQGPHTIAGWMIFMLREIEFALTLAQFNAIFCLLVGDTCRPLREFEAHKLWTRVADDAQTYDPSNCKTYFMPNPTFHYLQSVMAKTLFGREESDGNVRLDELFL
ncbi:unnamed protein product [Lupinus luteus]|uniref:Arabidopsis retrotransposon Orf1 C-terminal domain-containing protein n=1 Tax=Lupinus luteus TaxID=3873 RepID=A0AAV1WVI1_LUPLU